MDKVDIIIDFQVYHDMMEYAAWAYDHYNSEVGGYAHYNREDGIYKVAPLCKQICHSTEADVNPIDILNDPKYDMSNMNVWWHSHPRMDVSPSSKDTSTIAEWGKSMSVCIMLIINLEMEYYCRAYARNEFGLVSEYEGKLIPYFTRSEFSKEVLRKVKKPKPKIIRQVARPYGFDESDWRSSDINKQKEKKNDNLIKTPTYQYFDDQENWIAWSLTLSALEDKVNKLLKENVGMFDVTRDMESCFIKHRKNKISLYYNDHCIFVNGIESQNGMEFFGLLDEMK